jgi:DNA (cytosine-5)-methyltransferase 1
VATVTSVDHHSLVTAHITKFNTGSIGFAADTPMHTIIAGGEQARPGTAITQGVVAAHLVHMGHGEGKDGGKRFSHGIRDAEQPLNTITAQGMPAGLVTSHMVKLRGDNTGSPAGEPLHTVSAQGLHHGEVRAFMVKYYGTDQDPQLVDPLHTVTTKDRFGLVMVHGEPYAIVDIGLRMLTPRELYRAQGFPESYAIDRGADGRPLTKTAQVRMCGNSVCPPMAAALVRANYLETTEVRKAA